MPPAHRSAQICAAIGVIRYTDATRAARDYAKALDEAQRPLRLSLDGSSQWQDGAPLAETPADLSSLLVAALFGLPMVASGKRDCAKCASLQGLDVTEVWGSLPA